MAKRKNGAPGKAVGKQAKKAKKEAEEEENDDIEMNFKELVGAGAALQQLGAHEAAVEIYIKALDTSPDNIDVMHSLADAYEKTEEYEKAVQILRDIVAIAPTNSTVWFKLSQILVEQDAVDDAIHALKKVIELDGEDTSAAYAALASCYGEQGDIDSAVSLFEDAVSKHKENAKFHYNLATMLAARGGKKDHKRAIAEYKIAADLDPEGKAEVFEDLAGLYDTLGDSANALKIRQELNG